MENKTLKIYHYNSKNQFKNKLQLIGKCSNFKQFEDIVYDYLASIHCNPQYLTWHCTKYEILVVDYGSYTNKIHVHGDLSMIKEIFNIQGSSCYGR